MAELVIVGDEGWFRDEWDAVERRRERARRRYAEDPEYRAKKNAQARRWQENNVERFRQTKREWARAHRPVRVGSLHSLACWGPTRNTGCRCNENGTRKIPVYRRKEVA